MIDVLLALLPATAGLLALLFAPAVERWVERFDAWVEGPFYHLLNRLWKRS